MVFYSKKANILFQTILSIAVMVLITACSGKSGSDSSHSIDGDAVVPYQEGGAGGYGQPGYSSDELGPLASEVSDRVFFDYDSSTLAAQAQDILGKQADWLKANPNYAVVVEGHCDERGTREYNLALGERRANAARNYLVSLGVEPGRVTTISYGKERPEVLGSNESSWHQNRRAVTVLNR